MPISAPDTIFGVHSISAYDIETRKPLSGISKVVGSIEVPFEGEVIPLNGGSSKYPYKTETGLITSEASLTIKSYDDYLFEVLMGRPITKNAAEPTGSATTLTNAKGTSLVSATTGVASVGVKSGSESDVKLGSFVVEAVTATTVNVYSLSDLDFANGSSATYVDDSLKINETPLTITSGSPTEIPNFGLELTGGSGTIAMTPGDTATFTSRPINSKSKEIVFGSSLESYKSFGLYLTAQRASDKTMGTLDLFNVTGVGIPFNFTENAFSELSISLTLSRSAGRDGVGKFEHVSASN